MTRLMADASEEITGADLDLEATAAQALRLAALDPASARALVASVVERARRAGAWNAVSCAERALGVAALSLSELDVSITHLRAAVAAAQRGGSTRGEGEARMSLASAYVLRGRPSQASREIQSAMHKLDGLHAARAGVQHAAILQELGRNDEALHVLRGALPVLRRKGDAEWAARALSNRSLIHSQRRSFRAAQADLLDARRLCDDHGLELPGAYAEQNLGCLSAQRGDVPEALRHFDAADARYRHFGVLEPSLFEDRAHVLLSVRLLDEARATAESAVAAYEEQKRDVHVPQAQLLLSTVALVQGDTQTAVASAAAAARGFRRLGRTSALALARYAGIQAALAADPRAMGPARVARVAEELEAAKWPLPALEARVLAGRLALDQGRRTVARTYLEQASRARSAGPADARARAWLAEAMLRDADGRRPAALSALRAGVRIVDEYQATLGATELRAHVSAHRGALARAGLRMALDDQNPRRVLWWAERDRARTLLLRPARPPHDPELAHDLADLRSTMAELEESRSSESADSSALHRQLLLERRIRDRCRTLDSSGTNSLRRSGGSLDGLGAALGDLALVEYVESAGLLHAVTVARGSMRLHTLGAADNVRKTQAQVSFVLHRLVRRRLDYAAASASLEVAASTLDDMILRPLLRQVGDRPLVVVPTRALQSLPWSALPSCTGRPVTISPSTALWHKAVDGPPPAREAPVIVVAGPGLRGAYVEARAVAGLYRGARLLEEGAATAAGVLENIEGAAHLHLAAHGMVRSDNPLFSSLRLADGPLTVYELERLQRPPHRVTLAACDAGRAQSVTGDEVLGFGAALLAGGTATLVAPVVPVPDAATVPLMTSYHQRLVSGLSPSAALAAAQSQMDRSDGDGMATGAAFVCIGAG